MPADPVEAVANAVLYEGFLLYPYRRSSLKNQQRWNFGVLFPPGYCERSDSGETSTMQTECLVAATDKTTVTIKVRFLQTCGEEAVEREVTADEHVITAAREGKLVPFEFPDIRGLLDISSHKIDGETFRFTVRIVNSTSFENTNDRDQALQAALISTHTLLTVHNGAFHSLIDPPDTLTEAKNQCRNIGTWPVLIGREGDRDRLLSAPIVLYDYPKIAPQSPGDFFDGTEIDEMLSLRVLTLTDEEKSQMLLESRAAALLQRTENLPTDRLQELHGTFRREAIPGCSLKPGNRVRLRPKRRADIFDLALAGRTATVASIEQDFENNVYVCVTVEDDPGKDLGLEGKPGHRFFFGLDEVEPL